MKTKYALFFILIFSMSSCKKFLELTPQTSRNTADFYKTATDFNTAVVGNYAALKLAGVYNSSLIWMGEVSTDNTDYGKQRNTQLVDQFQFVDHNYTSLNSIIYAAWRDHYIGISRSNTIINRIADANIDNTLKQQYLGEAQFLRALFYFNLVRLYGGVPLVTQEITSPDGANHLLRASTEDIYQLIIDDLQSAEKNLPLTYNAADAGRAAKGAAQALLGKVYLTRKDWSKAKVELNKVITSQKYQLLPNYADVFSYATPTNAEILFNVQYKSGNTGQGSDFWQSFAPDLVTTDVLGTNGGSGKGINRPTQDMDNAYEMEDKRKDFSMQSSYLNAKGQTVEVRFVTKYKHYGALPGDTDVDFPILRYADVLLMYAEVLNESGNTSDALTFLNQIRERAGLPDKPLLGQEDFRLAIENERRVEFAFENQRWFDLIRTGRYLTVMNAKGYNVPASNMLFLIPQREIDLNPSLTQNSGY